MDLRDFIGNPEIMNGLSVDYEIAKALHENPEKTLRFTDVKGFKFDVVGNVVTSRGDVYSAIGTDKNGYFDHMTRCFENPVEPIVSEGGRCQESECSLYDLPVLRHFEKDGGRYITSGIVAARDPEYGRNASIHRLMLHEDNRLGIRIVPRHLREYLNRAEARGEDLDVAIAIGVHPLVFFAAAYSPPLGYDEFSLAGGMLGRPLEMVRCITVDVEIPEQAEFIIEGRIRCSQRAPEGPFADVTGTYDLVRDEPVIEVTRVTHRKDAVYQALLPSSIEHRLFMGMPREPGIYRSVGRVAEVADVTLTDGGKNWLHGAVSLKKTPSDVRAVIEAAFEGHPSMKHVIVVDSDIDVHDADELEYAVATRFQGHRDAYLFKGKRGSTLDPSTDEDGRTTKLGINATKPAGRKSDYEFARIP